MAAGRGMRLMPFSNFIPKALMPIYETSLISKGINEISKEINKICITVGYKKKELSNHVLDYKIHSIINTEGKGNCWWVYNSLFKNLDEPVLVMTCDNVTKLDYQALFKNYLKHNSPPVMIVGVRPINGIEGDYIKASNNIISKLSRRIRTNLYSSGIQIINPYKINQVTKSKSDFKFLWEELIKKKMLYLSDVKPKKWFSVDTLETLAKINR